MNKNDIKPLARWTIGPSGPIGLEILRESISLFKKAYPDFDICVCYNHIDPTTITELGSLVAQNISGLPLRDPDNNPEEASGCGWKLCPPRLRPHGHELWIDNDLVITKRLEEIDKWLALNTGLISEGLGRRRMYGCYDHMVSPNLHLCAGLFGLPPGFDFESEISNRLHVLGNKQLGGYDEQGLTASIVSSMNGYVLVPLSQLHISEDHVPFPDQIPPAIHFVAANRKNWHRGWKSYKRHRFMML